MPRTRPDVGFGACGPPAPMRLKDGESVRRDAWVHTLAREPGPTPGTPGPLVLRCLRQGGWYDLYAIGTEPRFPVDLTVTSHFTSTHLLSPFHGRMLVQRSTPGRRVVLHNLELTTLHTDLTSEKRRVRPGGLPLLLASEFGVHLDAADAAALVARYA
ncbi:arylamine N-acetyltransferase [Streptomyces lavendulae]|uniref:arylamine N-acetyltransferase n=1 Tax=Streptomyces lavendulae TaxID=1914 RepID=UPI0036C3A0ED